MKGWLNNQSILRRLPLRGGFWWKIFGLASRFQGVSVIFSVRVPSEDAPRF